MKTKQTPSTALILTLTVTTALTAPAFAAPSIAALAQSNVISVGQVSALARAAIHQETLSLNLALSGAETEDYAPWQLDAIRRAGATRLADDYLTDKCTYTHDNLLSMMDDQLTLADDAAAGRGTALSRIGGLYGRNFLSAISRACLNAEARFQERLASLTAGGKAVALEEETVDSLTNLLFYPTELGRPKGHGRIRAVLGAIFTAAVFVGSTSSLIGLPVGKVILSFAVPANSFMGLRNQIGGRSIPLRPDASVLLDLTADEGRFVMP